MTRSRARFFMLALIAFGTVLFAMMPHIAAAVGMLIGGWASDHLMEKTGSATLGRKLPVIVGKTGSFVGALTFMGSLALAGVSAYVFILGDGKRLVIDPACAAARRLGSTGSSEPGGRFSACSRYTSCSSVCSAWCAGTGTGPLGSHFCMTDAPTNNATGYHFLCFDPH